MPQEQCLVECPDPSVVAENAAPAPRPRIGAPQVSVEHYGPAYLNLLRMITYWHQVATVRRCGGQRVLEIGIGMGLTSFILDKWGYDLETLDFDPALHPTRVGDVREIPYPANSFDTILIAEVLEHIPYDDFTGALRELYRVTKSHVVVTLPCPLVGFSLGINVCGVEPRFLSLGTRLWTKPVFDGQHYWELGRRGYSQGRIREAIRSVGFEITEAYRPSLSVYSYCFVLSKKPSSG